MLCFVKKYVFVTTATEFKMYFFAHFIPVGQVIKPNLSIIPRTKQLFLLGKRHLARGQRSSLGKKSLLCETRSLNYFNDYVINH